MLRTTLKKTYVDKEHENVLCPLCESNRDYLLATTGYPGIPVRNVICKTCGLIRINPRMTKKGYDDFYKEDFFEYLNPFSRPAYVQTIENTTDDSFVTPVEKNIFPYLLPYIKEHGTFLDVGAGFGQVMYLLHKKKNVDAIGIEPDPHSRKIAKEKMGIDLLDITIEEFLQTNKNKFDSIFLDQVFEHLLDPLETLKQLKEVLNPDGILYIGVPNSYNPGVSMDRYYELAHTYGYTPSVMQTFAEKAGLKIVSIRDPYAHALEVIFAHADSSYLPEKEKNLIQGKNWWYTVLRLRRKEFLNTVRGIMKKLIIFLFGHEVHERVRKTIDSIFNYKY